MEHRTENTGKNGSLTLESPRQGWRFTWSPDWRGARVGHLSIEAPAKAGSRKRLEAKSWALGEAQARGLTVAGVRWVTLND